MPETWEIDREDFNYEVVNGVNPNTGKPSLPSDVIAAVRERAAGQRVKPEVNS